MEAFEEYIHPKLSYFEVSKNSIINLEFDVFVPSLNLAIEYQGLFSFFY